MKVRIDVECSPDEARAFFGLPDMRPVQAVFVEEMERKIRSGVSAMDAEAMMRAWMPGGEMMEQFKKALWPGGLGQKEGKGS